MSGSRVDVHVDPAAAAGREIDVAALARAAQAALAHGESAGRGESAARELSLALVTDADLAELHGRCLGDPSPTDVMSFELGEGDPEAGGAGPFGEVVVSVDCAARVAAERGVPFARELALYVVHGTLHLVGFDDHEPGERAAMRAAEAAVMGALGFGEDPAPHDREPGAARGDSAGG